MSDSDVNVFHYLIQPLYSALTARGYTEPTQIQSKAIPVLLEGKDLLGCAQTGTGKTAAFVLPMLARLNNNSERCLVGMPMALILVPTRELATQVATSVRNYAKYLKFSVASAFGGVDIEKDKNRMSLGVDVLVATPGRLLDLKNRGIVDLTHVEYFVIDEADRMLDLGFKEELETILEILPRKKQTAFFSATMSKYIIKLSQKITIDPVHIEVEPDLKVVENVRQRVYFAEKDEKLELLVYLLKNEVKEKVVIFVQKKVTADFLLDFLYEKQFKVEGIHGNLKQKDRLEAISRVKRGKSNVLIGTDIASRGLDIKGLTHVINYELPRDPENYVHRIGRTARAGGDGDAISFCSKKEKVNLKNIQKYIKNEIPVAE